MQYLLDTNICIYIIKQKPVQIVEKFKKIPAHHVSISSITVAELEYGVAKSQWPHKAESALEEFLIGLNIAVFDREATRCYGKLRALLEKQGNTIGPLDMLIAAHAQSLAACLVTNNLSEFQRVKNLQLENWVA